MYKTEPNRSRYSHYVVKGGIIYNDDGTVYTGSQSGAIGSTTTEGGWTAQNTVDTINTGANLIQTVLTSIFGRNNIQQAQYTSELYKQEQRTNTILWVVLGLVLALGVVLVIRKTK